jgi:transcriptional regulator with XRE-family HTH domain
MAAHEKQTARAERAARRALSDIGRELRLARLNHDLSQRVAARAAGVSPATWSRLERGLGPSEHLRELARALAVVGHDLRLNAYPAGSPLRDVAHVRLLEAFRRRLGPGVRWRTEVPLPRPGDRRSWDGLALVPPVRVGVKAETRAHDSQELQRRLAGKRRDGAVEHVILLLADTRHNRAFLRSVGAGFQADFPLPGREAMRSLARSSDPGGSAIVLLAVPRT